MYNRWLIAFFALGIHLCTKPWMRTMVAAES